jgi:hypothetical protein
MKIRFNFFNKFFFLFAYCSGLLIPIFYIYILKNIKKIYFPKNSKFLLFMIFVIIIQLFSTFISIYSDYNGNGIRYIAIYHNYLSNVFLIIGTFLFYKNIDLRLKFEKFVKFLYFFIIFCSLISFFISFTLSIPIRYKGIIALLTHVDNSYTMVNLTYMGYILNLSIPRISLLGIYPNTSAIIIFIIAVLYLSLYREKLKFKVLNIIIICLILIMTGSRIATIMFCIWAFIYMHKFRNTLLLNILIIFMLCLLNYDFFYLFFKELYDSRIDSSNTRLYIYESSIKFMLNNNVLLGIGYKPKFGDFPMGSHSSFIGFFFKHGLIGLIIISFVYFILIKNFFVSLLFYKKYFYKTYMKVGLFCLGIIFLFEDYDAYELIPFFTGILVYYSFYNKKKRIIS